jgi:predicted amidohydrolase
MRTVCLPALLGLVACGGGLDAPSGSDAALADAAAPDAASGFAPGRIALIQYDADAHFGDVDHNLAQLTAFSDAAVAAGATVIVQPEGSVYGYRSATETWCAPGTASWQSFTCRDVSTIAEVVPGGTISSYWQSYAVAHAIFVVYSVPEVDGDAFYNTVGIVGPDGFVAKYRKRSLYYIDEAYCEPGAGNLVLTTPYGRFGMLICLDATYDGPMYDEYLDAGVNGILLPMDWDQDPTGTDAAVTWFADRARNNDVDIYAADQSSWDGTGKYVAGETRRERSGLPEPAVGIDGASYHDLAY